MRAIKFRGKHVDSGEWIFGSLLIGESEIVIYSTEIGESIVVAPETIGQFADLKDHKGNDIYEGDILLCTIVEEEPYHDLVIWKEGAFYLADDDSDPLGEILKWHPSEYTVIGNIYEHKHLLEKEAELENEFIRSEK